MRIMEENGQKYVSLLIPSAVEKEICEEIFKALIKGRLENILRAHEIDYSRVDSSLYNLLNKVGVVLREAEPSQLEKDIESYLKVSRDKFREWPRDNQYGVSLYADLVLTEWGKDNNNELSIVYQDLYDERGNIMPRSFEKIKERSLPKSMGMLLLYKGIPLYVRFELSSSDEYYLRVHGFNSESFIKELEKRLNEYLIGRYKGKILNYNLIEVKLKIYKREELVYPADLSRQVDELVVSFKNWIKKDCITRWGYMLIGKPGTGKTTIGGLLAGLRPGGCTFLYCPAADIKSPRQLINLFQWAEWLAPTIIQIDDVDLIAPDRCSDDGEREISFTSTLMECLEGLKEDAKIFTILTTNKPKRIESAIINRAGRVSGKIIFQGFGRCLFELIAYYAKKFDLCLDKEIIKEAVESFSDKVDEFTPDETKNICERLCLLYEKNKITKEQLIRVIDEVYDIFHNLDYQKES